MQSLATQFSGRTLPRFSAVSAGVAVLALLLASALPVMQAGVFAGPAAQAVGSVAESVIARLPAAAQVAPASRQIAAGQTTGANGPARDDYNYGLASKPLAATSPTITIAQSGGFTLVDEGSNTSDTFTVVLSEAPTSEVSVHVGAGVTALGTHQVLFTSSITTTASATAILTFTSSNYYVAQTVTVTAVDDSVGEGRHTAVITARVNGSPSRFQGVVAASFTAEITDNDKALLLADTAGSTDVTEGGVTDSYTVALSMQPTGTVVVEPYNVSSAQMTFSPASLSFSSTNYNVPQVVTVTAVDDSRVEGYHTELIGHTVANYFNTNREQAAPTSLTANISDNDSRVLISETGTGTTVREGGGVTDTYTVVLLTAPTGHVSVTIGDGMYLWQEVPSGTDYGVTHDVTFVTAGTTTATSTVTLTFTPSNYSTAQLVTVTAYDDRIKEGVEKISITHHVRSITNTGGTTGSVIDSTYNETPTNRVVATVLDNEAGLATLGADFDGDGKTDYAIFRPSTSQFFVKKSASNSTDVITWGDSAQSDRPVPADYDGDGKSDHAIYRPATAQFFVKKSSTGAAEVVTWGIANGGDKPSVGDFDGDGKIDYAIFRASTAQFFVKNSADNSVSVVTWGIANGSDTPVVADYDGDGKADYAIYRRSFAQWFIKQSSNLAATVVTWGEATSADIPVPGDYDGDGKADATIYRPSTAQFFVRQSTTTTAAVTTWGIAAGGDVPVPGDYDGDGKTDKAIFRPSLAMFIVQQSSTLTAIDPPVTWGVAGGADYPLPVPDPNSDGTVYGFIGS